MTMKYFYPNDQRLDYLLANCLPDRLRQTPDIIAFIYCNDPEKTADQYNGVPTVKMPLTYYSPLRGAFIHTQPMEQSSGEIFDGSTDRYLFYITRPFRQRALLFVSTW